MTQIPVRRAILSVWDKSGLVPFAERLVSAGVELISSGGTAKTLDHAGLPVTRVESLTGSAEILSGRVKTLHPVVYGAILADVTKESHRLDLEMRGIDPVELVVVNLYPFEDTIAGDATTAEIIEQIDIGGPAMVRAAAKNHGRVGVVVESSRYEEIAMAVESGGLDDDLRSELAREAFFRTAMYDAAIVTWLEGTEDLPKRMVLALEQIIPLRYGENPHQKAAAYADPRSSPWWRQARQFQGKKMSFNNYLDAESAWRLVYSFDEPAVAIIKHSNPCGVAIRGSLLEAFRAAWECDPRSAFGGVLALNRTLDLETADSIMSSGFVEVVIAPDIHSKAAKVFSGQENLRLISAAAPDSADPDLRRIESGFVVQTRDRLIVGERSVVSHRTPTKGEMADLEFAWRVAAHTKSNAIVLARNGTAVGVGAGDQSRVGAAERAIDRAGERSRGSVAASDAFFPFRDGLDALAEVGVTAVIEPGGSIRDDEVISAANEHDIALVFTGRRHFFH